MSPLTSDSQVSSALKRRLRDELRWLRLRLCGQAALRLFVAWGCLLLAAAVSYPGWARLGPAAAWTLVGALAVVLLWIGAVELWWPMRRVAHLGGFSRELERHGDYRNLLETATQFSSRRREDPLRRGASPELVDEILRRAAATARSMRLAPKIPLEGVLSLVPAALLVALGWAGLGVSAPQRVESALGAILHPARLAHHPPEQGLYAASGDLRVPVGGTVELRARDFVGGDEPVVLEIDRTGGFWQQRETEVLAGEGRPPLYFVNQVRLDGVENPFRYRFRKGALTSAVHRVDIRQRPVLSSLRLRLEPPAYTGESPVERDDPSGTLDLLEGTRVRLSATASAPLSSAVRREVDGEAVQLPVDGSSFSDDFVLREDKRFHLDLTDTEGLDSETHTIYSFLARPDRPPLVEITAPGEDRPLDRSLRVGIAGVASDDLRLQKVDLVWRAEPETTWHRLPLYAADAEHDSAATPEVSELKTDASDKEVAVAFTWDVGDVELLPGDAVLYALEATDNDGIEGPNVTRSKVYRLRLPTIAEVFETDRGEREEDTGRLDDLRKQGRELAEDLQRLDRELKKNPTPDWEKQEEIKETLERQQELRKKLESTAEDLRRQQEEFQRENAGSLETLEKMEMVQELLDDLKDDQSLQAYLEAMEKALDEIGPQEVQRQMSDALADQEEFNRRLDRTLELLRQLERERTMGELREEVSDHLQRQEQLAERTQPSPTDSTSTSPSDSTATSPESDDQGSSPKNGKDEEIARAQEQLEREARALEERLQKQLEQLQQQMEKEGSDPVAEQMEQSLEEALQQMRDSGKPSESMDDAGEKLDQGKRQEANQSQREAMARLLHLYQVLTDGMQGMQQASGKAAYEQLQQTAFDLLDLSHGEEDVVDALRGGIRGQRMRPIARQHARVTRSTTRLSDSLHDLAQKNFRIPERLLSEMRGLVDLLDEGTDELKLARTRRARDLANEAMARMNRTVISLLTAAQNAQGQGGGGSQPTPSQQMQQMSEEQSRLNGMTQELRRKMQQGFSEQEKRQLAELHQRQQALRQQLESMRKQLDDERRVLGDLDDLGKAMEEVAEDLGAGRLTDQTQRQQDKILSRLLDAQRSVRERDFAKRREARGAEELFRPQLGVELPNSTQDENGRLRRWRAPDVAPHAYREDVRRYFRSLDEKLGSTDTKERR